jgi:TRAP-type C4-dicarboxylate transport system permease large subunit
MALLMSLAAGVPAVRLGGIITDGAVQLAPVYVAVVFGALLGRVTIETGIARRIVDLAAEFGGEQPLALALGFCAIVAVLFTSISGLGGIIMVGSIVLPIMMTAGVPRTIAATLFLMGFALGYIFNIASWTFYTTYFGVSPGQLLHFAVVLAIVDAIALVLYAVISFRRERGYATWAVRAETAGESVRVPAVALITPVVPLVLYYAFHMGAAPAFLAAALFGVLVTRPSLAVQRLVAAAIRGVEDVAPAVLLFIGIGMLLVATRQPQFTDALRPLVAGTWLRSPIGYVTLFGVASPLVLYRGPLNPFGVGIAIFTVLLSTHVLPPVVLVAAVMAVSAVQNVCDPTNTANVWIANFTGVPINAITRRTLPYQTGVAVVATLAVVIGAPALFGKPAFTSLYHIARAGEAMPGFYAPQASRDRIAVDDDGTPFGRIAADEVTASLKAGALTTMRLHDDPNARDCAAKRYTAYLLVGSSSFLLVEGEDVDVGLRLEDCGGWTIDEWHDHELVSPHASRDDVRELALQGTARLRAWSSSEPVRSENLFARGAAVAPGDKPAYFYALFRTVDGNLRLYVRAGGPAYAAGLRSGEVVEKIDGQEWWRYGTYRSEQFAYDGKPHTFEVRQENRAVDIMLGAPFVVGAGDGE